MSDSLFLKLGSYKHVSILFFKNKNMLKIIVRFVGIVIFVSGLSLYFSLESVKNIMRPKRGVLCVTQHKRSITKQLYN